MSCFHDRAGAAGGLDATKIYISNLPDSVTEESLAALLSETSNVKVIHTVQELTSCIHTLIIPRVADYFFECVLFSK